MISNNLHKNYSNYRYCIVRECKNTSIKTPEKLWIRLPSETNIRKTWLRLAHRDPDSLSPVTQIYFCEDHFDLEKDMDNYMQYKIMGSVKRIRMKPGCVPSRFESQSKKRKRSSTPDLPISEDSEPIDPLEISTSSFQVKQEKEDDQLDNDLEVSFDIPVKQEKDLEVSFDIPNKEENGLEISCDIPIKEENDLEITFDLPIKEEQIFVEDSYIHNTIPEHQDYQESISYEKLKEDFNDTCIVCNKFFNDRFSLYQHNLIHLKVRLHKHELFACDYSSYFVKNQTHLIERKPKKRKTRRSQCKICCKSFSYRYMHEHRRIVHGELKIKCDKCDIIFKCKKYWKRHNCDVHERCTENVEIACEKCPAKFNNKDALRRHVRNCHSDESYQCNICTSTLKCKSYLITHMRRVHYNDGKEHSCGVCGKIFKSPNYVRDHMKHMHKSYLINQF